MSYTFAGCSSLEEITLPAIVTTIQNHAFQNCTSLAKVHWDDALTTIDKYAFENCDALTEANLPANVATIGEGAFYDCDGLTKVTIPNSVTSLGSKAFYTSELLHDVTLGTGLTTIPTYAFYECPALESIVIPYRVAKINDHAFANCTNLTSVTIPRATTTISSNAFSYPAKMTVYGVAGTYAETYANERGMKFVNQEIPATSVTLTPSTLTLNKGATATLAMTVEPANFTDVVSWKSSDTSVVTIADTGVVTAKAVGTATIKLIVGNVSTSCKVTVVQPVTSITLDKTSLSLEALQTYQLKATVNPSNAQDKTVSWESSDPAVATVDQNGLVTALTKGSATITVRAMDGSNISKTCSVTVTNTAHVCSTVDELESPHNYANNCNDFWVYTQEGVTKLLVTFDERTCIEDGFDYLYIFDGTGTQIDKYTGDELAGQTVQLTGNTVRIKLVSDDSGNEWGFKVLDVSSSCKHPHVVTDEAVEPTCTETGLTEGSHCADCDAVIVKQEVVPALGHQLTKVSGKAPACEEEGLLEHWKCERCGLLFADEAATTELDEDDIVLPPAGHKPGEAQISDEIPATCTEAGSYVRTVICTVCGKELERETVTVPALGHSIEEWVITKPATCGEAGLQEGTCVVCGEKATEVIPATGDHSYTETITKATLTADGHIDQTCEVCGDTITTVIYHPATFKLSTTSYTYNGSAKKPTVTVTDANGEKIAAANYTVTYSNNTNAGKATAKITFKGNYSGTKSLTFTIKAKAVTPAVTLSATSYTWNGKVKKPTVTVKDGTKVIDSADYTVTYASGRKNVGSYKVTVTMDGNYSGSKSVTFKINPKGTTVKSLTAASKAITVKWTKQETKMSTAHISGYQIQLATDSKFTKNVKSVTVSGYSSISKKVTSLKGGVKYYVRIRTYKTISGTKFYSPWSAAKITTTKK